MQRFFLNQTIEDPQKIVIQDKDVVKKITKVLRKQIGETIFIFDSTNEEYEVKITEILAKQIICRLVGRVEIDRELPIKINLYQALLKKDKLEWICQKATEIGVVSITPIISENCVVRDLNKNKVQRLEKIISEATMQCGGKIPPKIERLATLAEAIKNLDARSLNLIAHEQEEENTLIEILSENRNAKVINLFIGPEGGFSQFEIDLARQNSLQVVSLGSRILRAETAAIVGCGLIAQV